MLGYEQVSPYTAVNMEWQPCKSSPLKRARCYTSTYNAPSSYENDSSTCQIQLYVEKFRVGDKKNGPHVIYLGGGPGNVGASNYEVLNEILRDMPPGTTLYVPDHRGLGRSTPLDPSNRADWHPYLKEIIEKAPFPLEHMTLSNAALDACVLGGLIKGIGSDIQVSVMGVSYGAHLAYHAASLVPNMFQSILLFGTPNVYGTTQPETDKGLLDNCRNNEYCKKLMGGNVEDIQDDLTAILNPDLNECTKMFYKDWKKPIQTETAICGVLARLSQLLRGCPALIETNHFHSSQLAFAFIRTTSKCIHPETYEQNVLTPLLPYMQVFGESVLSEGVADEAGFSKLINSLILLDKMFEFNRQAPFEFPKTVDTLLPTSIYAYRYWRDFDVLKDVIGKMKKSKNVTLKTNTSKIVMVHGEVDLNTTIDPARRLFDDIQAPTKRFLVYRNRGHTGLAGPCREHIIKEGLFNGDSSATDRCMASQNAQSLDWTFTSTPFSSVWNTSEATFHSSRTFLVMVGISMVLFVLALAAVLFARYRRKSIGIDI